MNIEVFIGCIILATGIFLRFWSFDKKCEFRAIAEVLKETCDKNFDPKWMVTYWYYDRMSMLGKALTHAGIAVIAYYHSLFRSYSMIAWGVTIAMIVSFLMVIGWTLLYREHARCVKALK